MSKFIVVNVNTECPFEADTFSYYEKSGHIVFYNEGDKMVGVYKTDWDYIYLESENA